MPLTYTQTPYSNLQGSVVNNEVALDYSNLDFRPEIGDKIEVYNDTTKLTDGTGGTTVNYTLDTSNTDVILKVNTFTPGTTISVYRIAKKDTRAIDFQNASVLTEADLDNSAFQTFHIAQEALDTAEQSITVNADGTFNANNARIVNLADPSGDQDAATKAWVNSNANTTTVAGSIANVNTVAGSISNVNTVATNISNVNTVNSNVTNVNKVAAVDSDVTTVAGIDSNVTTVAGVSGNVSTVAGISSDVTGVANISSAVSAVNSNASNINAVNSNSSNINTVAGNNSNINTVAGIDSNITTVAGISGNVTTVATNNANVTTVAQQIADVNNFADTYFGSSSSASGPTGTFTAGDLYFSTYNSENKLKVYNGSSWQNATSAVEGVATITEFNSSTTPAVNGSTTHFPFSHDVGLQIVFLNGVRLIQGTDYNSVNSNTSTSNITSGTASHLHFSTPPANGDVLSVMGFGTVTSTAVVPVSGGTFSGNVAVNGDLTVDTNTLKVDASGNKVGIGTATVDEQLHLKGTKAVIKLQDSDVTDGEGYVDFDGSSLQLNVHRNPNTGLNPNNKAPASIILSGNNSDSSINFYTKASNDGAATKRMGIDKDGDVTVSTGNLVIGTAGKGINFSVNSTENSQSASNVGKVLYDFEQGEYNPAITATGTGSSASSGLSASRQGFYTRVGDIVHVVIHIVNSSWVSGPSGTAVVTLPFTVKANYSAAATIGYVNNFDKTPINAYANQGTNLIYLFVSSSTDITNTSGITNLQGSEVNSNSNIQLTATYRVS